MKTIKFKNIVFIGDIHGDMNQITYYQNFNKLRDTLFIQLGDYGIGFKQEYKEIATLDFYNTSFKSKRNYLYVVRGNHDNPKYFTGKYDKSNIKLVPDWSVLPFNINDQIINILFIGGAVSVDRYTRKGYITGGQYEYDYWKDEVVVYNNEIDNIKGIDIVVTHTAPDFCQPVGFNTFVTDYAKRDNHLLEDLTIERELMTKIHDKIKLNNVIKRWLYGHYHFNNDEEINGTKFSLVDMNSFKNIDYI